MPQCGNGLRARVGLVLAAEDGRVDGVDVPIVACGGEAVGRNVAIPMIAPVSAIAIENDGVQILSRLAPNSCAPEKAQELTARPTLT